LVDDSKRVADFLLPWSLPDPRRIIKEPYTLFIGTGREGVRLLDVAEIACASGYWDDAWENKGDAEQLTSIKVTLNNWGQIDDWTPYSGSSANVATAVT
jgi:hypothetical protein